jgi:ferritin
MNAKLNEQIGSELYSSQIYLAMACLFEEQGLKMLAKLYRKQTEEERGHALKILDYLGTVEGKVKLRAIAEPSATYPSVLAALEAALEHERKVTGQINALMTQAESERDYATCNFLKWYVDEQVEEVDSQLHLVQIARLAGPYILQLEGYVARLVN